MNPGVDIHGFAIRIEYIDTRHPKKRLQQVAIGFGSAATQKPRLKFGECDERDPDFLGVFKAFDDSSLAAKKVREAMGVDEYPQRQSLSSIWRCSVNTRSNSGSSVHRPAR